MSEVFHEPDNGLGNFGEGAGPPVFHHMTPRPPQRGVSPDNRGGPRGEAAQSVQAAAYKRAQAAAAKLLAKARAK